MPFGGHELDARAEFIDGEKAAQALSALDPIGDWTTTACYDTPQ
jgi:hypothetical protein